MLKWYYHQGRVRQSDETYKKCNKIGWDKQACTVY